MISRTRCRCLNPPTDQQQCGRNCHHRRNGPSDLQEPGCSMASSSLYGTGPGNRLQRERQILCRLEPILWVFFQAVANDLLIRRRNLGLLQIGTGRLFAQDRSHRVDFRFALKGPASGYHLVENRAKAEDVTAVIDCLAAKLLRRHVGYSAYDRAVLCDRGQILDSAIVFRAGLKLGYSEVKNLYAIVVRDEQILWFQITMNNMAIVCSDKRVYNLERILGGISRRDTSFT